MELNRVLFAGVTIELPAGWYDITDDLGIDAPFTLARSDGVGALQFSVASYKSGENPQFEPNSIRGLLEDFFAQKNFGMPTNFSEWSNAINYARGDYVGGDDFYRIWYVGDEKNIALITYTTELRGAPLLDSELEDAEAIVRSLRFA